MDLTNYTTEELKAELKRRVEEKSAQKSEEMKTAKRCRNRKHCIPHPKAYNFYHCAVRTWGKKLVRNYCVTLSTKACDKFERKEE